MGSTSKRLALFFIVLVTLSSLTLVTTKPANAQIIPKPSIPQFTVTFIPNYMNSTRIDPYTGANITTTQNLSTINITITNQQYSYSNGSAFSIYYNVRVKGHFDSYGWNELYSTTQLLPSTINITQLNPNSYQWYEVPYIWAEGIVNSLQVLSQTNSAYTTASLQANNYPSDGQVDIQVEAMVGVSSTYYRPSNSYPYGPAGSIYPAIAYVTSSGWSDIKTINLTNGSVSPTPLPTPTPAVPELTWLMLVPLLLSVFAVVVIVRHRRTAGLKQ